MENRFLSHVEKTDTCWLWSPVRADGYGQLTVDSKTYPAHRLAYELWIGEIPRGLVIRHKCRNRHCVNPEHLETGTREDNEADKVDRRWPEGDKPLAALYSSSETAVGGCHPSAAARQSKITSSHKSDANLLPDISAVMLHPPQNGSTKSRLFRTDSRYAVNCFRILNFPPTYCILTPLFS